MARTAAGTSRRLPLVTTAAVTGLLLVLSMPGASPAAGDTATSPQWDDYGFQGEGGARIDNADWRTGWVTPSAAQVTAAQRLGATAARWNRFGTPHVLINHAGALTAPRSGDAAEIARAFVRENAELFRLDAQRVGTLELLRNAPLHDSPDLGRVRDDLPPLNPDVAHVVLFRQRFGELHAGLDGLLTVGVQRDGAVAWVSSSVTGDSALEGARRLGPVAAIKAAAEDVGMDVGALTEVDTPDDPWTTFASDVVEDVQRARLVAVPTPRQGVRRAWEVTLIDTALDEHGNPRAFISFVDAETGRLLQRSNQVEHFADGADAAGPVEDPGTNSSVPLPRWKVFPANPPFVTDANKKDDNVDTRVLWCWDRETDPKACAEEQRNTAARLPWDTRNPSVPTFTTDGNNATTAVSDVNFLLPDVAANRPVSPVRSYDFAWKNAWHRSSCNPANFGTVADDRNDEAAATTNLFVMHNRMHDWSYYLGFTEENYNMQESNFGNTGPERENDPELGQSQGGRRTPVFGRDNANQGTLQDGIAPFTNQYLWQPLAGAFYSPCVDGAYDMAVVAHEYTHAISNRMIAGPDGGTGDTQGQTESWSDLGFAAYFSEFAISAGKGVDPVVLGPYVTGDTESAIRNHAMNNSPLQYGDLEYDGNGLESPHANGEIWSATNYDILRSLAAKYDRQFPSRDVRLQRSCARGELPADECPGNRRWNQIQFDSFLLMPQHATMVDSRDAMLAADKLRFGGANQRELWDAFARRGLGQSAKSKPIAFVPPPLDEALTADRDDLDPTPAYDSPLRRDEAQVRFTGPAGMEVFVGQYEARVTPVADLVRSTPTDAVEPFVPGTYRFVARADGFGMHRFTRTFRPGERVTVAVPMQRNHASARNGATVTGDGVNLSRLIDDTEETNWASRTSAGTASEGKGEGRQVEGRQVTVDLAGTRPVRVTDVSVSAALNGGCSPNTVSGECEDEELPSQDPGTQNRFSALRSFDIWTCNSARRVDCSKNANWTKVFSSPDDAFPAARPRPKVPDLILRSFDVRDTLATHVRMVVRDNQCTGGPDYQGETNPDNDPAFNPDCDTAVRTPDRALLSPPAQIVRAAELQVFSRR